MQQMPNDVSVNKVKLDGVKKQTTTSSKCSTRGTDRLALITVELLTPISHIVLQVNDGYLS